MNSVLGRDLLLKMNREMDTYIPTHRMRATAAVHIGVSIMVNRAITNDTITVVC